MPIADQLNSLRTTLNLWAADHGGACEIAGDIVHAFTLLQHVPGGIRAVLWYQGEEKRGGYEESRMFDRQFVVFLSRGRGFELNPGDNLTRTGAGDKVPLFHLVEEAHEVIHAFAFPAVETEGMPDIKAVRPFSWPSDKILDAYQIEFTIGVDLSAPFLYQRNGAVLLQSENSGLWYWLRLGTYTDPDNFTGITFKPDQTPTTPPTPLPRPDVALSVTSELNHLIKLRTADDGSIYWRSVETEERGIPHLILRALDTGFYYVTTMRDTAGTVTVSTTQTAAT